MEHIAFLQVRQTKNHSRKIESALNFNWTSNFTTLWRDRSRRGWQLFREYIFLICKDYITIEIPRRVQIHLEKKPSWVPECPPGAWIYTTAMKFNPKRMEHRRLSPRTSREPVTTMTIPKKIKLDQSRNTSDLPYKIDEKWWEIGKESTRELSGWEKRTWVKRT